MRAAAILAGTIVVIGIYLAIAAAVTMTAGAAPTSPANRVARS